LTIPTLCLAMALAVTSWAQDGAEGRGVELARQHLADGSLDVTDMAVHAATLLDAGDLTTLREVLGGDSENAIAGTLRAMRIRSDERLVGETLELAAWARWEGVAADARTNLAELAGTPSSGVVDQLVGWLKDGTRPDRERLVLIEVLGASRNLKAVEPLIEQLKPPHGAAAHRALMALTGHDPRPPGALLNTWGDAWRAFWAQHRSLPRDRLLELALAQSRERLARARAAHAAEVAGMVDAVVSARTELMGQDIDRLMAGLGSRYDDVRRTAAERLGRHDNKQRASAAVPVIMQRLGYGEGQVTEGETPAVEDVPAVRAALVRTLGELARQADDVRAALSSELDSEHAEVAAAAVEALALVRGQPDVVPPLLDYLERVEPGPDETILVLGAVAANQPRGVIPRLRRWLRSSHPPRVRAAAVRALLASADVPAALTELVAFDVPAQDQGVRYSVAAALGERLLTLEDDSPARSRIVSVLGDLLDDVEPSVRAQAASSLGRSGELGALALLESRSNVETEESVLEKLVSAVGDLGFEDGVSVVGRVCGQRDDVAETDTLDDAGRSALAAIGRDLDANGWLAMGQQLFEVSALTLAAWCFQETERRFSAAPEFRDVVDQARGLRAQALWQLTDHDEANSLLLELHQADAPYPSPRVRLELLALTSEKLGQFSEAADFFLQLLALIQEGAAGREEVQRDAIRVLRKAGRFEEALTIVDALLVEAPEDNDLLHERSRIQEGLGQWEDALTTLRRLLDRIPSEDTDLRAAVEVDINRLTRLSHPTEAHEERAEP
jgi:hypothetical protein